jgi:NADH pyrophosphatase NudC (nudix superfamily)
VLAVDRPWQELDEAISGLAGRLLDEGIRIRSVTGEVSGPATPLEVCDDLEAVLVGAAATARSASERVRYDFCPDCGRKGRYRRGDTDLVRCKYCGTAGVSR